MKIKTSIRALSFLLAFIMLFTSGFGSALNALAADASVPAAEEEAAAVYKAAANPLIKANPDTICNPINIGYQYQTNFSARESADPEIIYYKGDYFLFASHGTGYWYTKDFANWNYVMVSGTPAVMTEWARFAPGACVIGDTVYIAMSDGGSILKSDNPYDGASWSIVGKPISNCYDPALLVDDDGRVYCYYGNAGVGGFLPLSVQELDPNNNMAKVGTAKTNIIPTNRDHGFEVVGDDNRNFTASVYNEGLYCTKYNGKYYLQYATPGTQFLSYTNGCYISDSPTGPFIFCENSPISYKSTGFVAGSGHGSLVKDEAGNWWKFDTSSISVSHNFERRLSVYPAKFDQYGQLVSNTAYLDYPMYKMTVPHNNFEERPDWNLVSYGSVSTVSSTLSGHEASKAFDESMRTWWSAETGDAGEWIQADLGKVCDINAVQINFADQDITRATAANVRDNTWKYRYLLEFSLDGKEWFTVVDQSNAVAEANKAQDTSHDYYELVSATKAQYVRLTNKGPVPAEGKFAVSGLRLFGNGGGEKPAGVAGFIVNRFSGAQPDDERSVIISWDAAERAEGYIIRFGNKPDSLSLQYKVIGETSARINMLNKGVDYYFSIDTYNDSGITQGDIIKTPIRMTISSPVEQIVSGYAANIPVLIATDEACAVSAELFGKRVPVIDGKALISLNKDEVPVVEAGAIFKITAYIGDTAVKTCDIHVAPKNDDIWTVQLDKSVEGKTRFLFAADISTLKGYKAVVNGTSTFTPAQDGNALVIDYAAKAGDTFVISGVKYAKLFPSYSFTFTVK